MKFFFVTLYVVLVVLIDTEASTDTGLASVTCDSVGPSSGATWKAYCQSLHKECTEADRGPKCDRCIYGYQVIYESDTCTAQQCSDFSQNGFTWDFTCRQLNRRCKKEKDKVPVCGACLLGYVTDSDQPNTCRHAKCSDSYDADNTWDEYCRSMSNKTCSVGWEGVQCRCPSGHLDDGIGGCAGLNEGCCVDLSSPADGSMEGGCVGAMVGDVCTFSCNHGFVLKGQSTFECGYGQWRGSGGIPTCIATPAGCDRELSPGLTARSHCENINTNCQSFGNLYRCRCPDGFFYNPLTMRCEKVKIDVCYFMTLGKGAYCNGGKITCRSGFKAPSEDGTCQPVPACGDDSRCGNAKCQENPDSPSDPFCTCPEGYYFSKSSKTPTCESIACHFRSLNHCQQDCKTKYDPANPSTETYECLCYNGFTKDGDTCVPEEYWRCGADCGNGSCVRIGDKMECRCNQGFEMGEDMRCTKPKRLCSVDKIPEENINKVCPKYELRNNKFVCVCGGKFKEDGQGVCQDMTICTAAQVQDCNRRNGRSCSRKQDDTYECECRGDEQLDREGICKPGCFPWLQFMCSSWGATCMLTEKGLPTCDCGSPYLSIMEMNSCEFVAANYSYTLSVPGIREGTHPNWDILNYSALFEFAMKNILGAHLIKAKLLSCDHRTSGHVKYLDCQAILILDEDNDIQSLASAIQSSSCAGVTGLDTDCVIGGHLLVQKDSYLNVQLSEGKPACYGDPCRTDKTNAECVPDQKDRLKFSCQCPKGFNSDVGISHENRFLPNYCYATTKNKDTVIVGSVLGGLLFLVVVAAGIMIFRFRTKEMSAQKRDQD